MCPGHQQARHTEGGGGGRGVLRARSLSTPSGEPCGTQPAAIDPAPASPPHPPTSARTDHRHCSDQPPGQRDVHTAKRRTGDPHPPPHGHSGHRHTPTNPTEAAAKSTSDVREDGSVLHVLTDRPEAASAPLYPGIRAGAARGTQTLKILRDIGCYYRAHLRLSGTRDIRNQPNSLKPVRHDTNDTELVTCNTHSFHFLMPAGWKMTGWHLYASTQ